MKSSGDKRARAPPPQLRRALARRRFLFPYNTRAALTADLPSPTLARTKRMRGMGSASNELCSLGKETNESISNVWLQY